MSKLQSGVVIFLLKWLFITKKIFSSSRLYQVEREKLRSEEIASKSVMERTSLDRSLCKVEEDNQDLALKVQNLQAQLAEAEQQHAQR